MWKLFYPDHYVSSTFTIRYRELYEKGYRGLLFDIDNTLVPHNAPADERAVMFFQKLRSIGFKTMIVSNNKEPRVKSFCDAVGAGYIFKANKPLKSGYLKAMAVMETAPHNTVFIGDQIFTDTLGAKALRILTYLVMPIDPREEIQIVLKRIPERWILNEFLKTHCLEYETEEI